MMIWGISDVGAVRKQNQDAYYISQQDGAMPFAVVCDGMGGAKAGNIASQMAVDTFVEVIQTGLSQGQTDVQALLKMGVERANEIVRYRAEVDTDCDGMGTTLVAAVMEPGKVHLINVGDSRAYLVTAQGITQLTRDHSVVEDLVERGEITHEEARLHPQKNLITRALGTEMTVEADLYTIDREPNSLLLLCSDGLSNVATDQEILFELVHGGTVEEGCDRLLRLALERGAPDNVTAVLIEL